MKISWKFLSEFVDLSRAGSPEKLAALLTSRGLEVESIDRQDQGLGQVVTAQILKREPHPQADRLSLCQVSTGGDAPLEIVCGAQNMKAGDKVALAQIGALLPNGLKIEKSKIRGVVSNGMLCSEEELKLKEKSEGILILPPSTPLGRPLAEILGRDDVLLEIKLTANRGDCMSHGGLAREIAAALGVKPSTKWKLEPLKPSTCPIAVSLEAGDLAPQFFGVYIEGVRVGPSPDWLARRLEGLGSRSINNVVDATNLVMLELGHPLHAYDADRIEGKKILVRTAKKGEILPLLDGTQITLEGFELVIADGSRAVGLAGVMGGGNSEVRDSTTRVFLECAEFDARLVRRAASLHQKRTEAAQRFEKGIDPRGLERAISRLKSLVLELAGGTLKGVSVSQGPSRKNFSPKSIEVQPRYFSDFLGMSVDPENAKELLSALECEVKTSASGWSVQPPSYRHDLVIREDLAEEIARSMGYDKIPETIPVLSGPPVASSSSAGPLALQLRVKHALQAAGLNEALNLSFSSRAWLEKLGMRNALALKNPLSEEHEVMVPSLLPGLLRNALDNWHHHFGSENPGIRLFELRPVFSAEGEGTLQARGEMETGARERWKLALLLSGPRIGGGLRAERGDVDFYDLKAAIEAVTDQLGTRGARISPLSESRSSDDPVVKLLHPGQSAELLVGNSAGGWFGRLHPAVALELKVRAQVWLAELDWEILSKQSPAASQPRIFKPWSTFPVMERDFALVVGENVTADKITQVAMKAGKPIAKSAKIFDIYKGSQVASGKISTAVRILFFDEARSLQETETEEACRKILEAWKAELGAELRN